MSVSLNIDERRLWIGVIKLAVSLVFVFAAIAVAITLLADSGQGIAVGVMLLCLGFSFLANGVLAVLKVIDWFDARKAKSNG